MHLNDHITDFLTDNLHNLFDFLSKNVIAVTTFTTGLILGQTEPHHTLAEYLTSPVTVGLIKDYVSIALAVGGFVLMLYNTFKKKKK